MPRPPKCPRCHGRGHDWKDCHDCAGEGTLEDCPHCGQTRPCKTCRGSGLLPDRENPCRECTRP